jgi:hypothetical protein
MHMAQSTKYLSFPKISSDLDSLCKAELCMLAGWRGATLSGSMSKDIRRRSGSRGRSQKPFRGMRHPRDLIHDRDSIYGTAVTRRLRAMGIHD